MESLEPSNEAEKQLALLIERCAKEARKIDHSMIMNDENGRMKNERNWQMVNPESYWRMHNSEYSIAIAFLRGFQQPKKGNAVETATMNALMNQTENEMKTSGNLNPFPKITMRRDFCRRRKPQSIEQIFHDDFWQSRSETKTTTTLPYFDSTNDEKLVNLSSKNISKNEQNQKLEMQTDKMILGEKNSYEKMSIDQNALASSSAKVCRKRSESQFLKLYQKHDCRTFSTFQALEREELLLQASHIYDGATFQSFDEFGKYFEAYKIVGNYPYRVASSEVLRDGEGKVIERFKYKYIVFHCAHYGNPRKRGGGKRPNQSYLPLGCRARFRLNADTTNGCLRISSFHDDHVNHENNEEDYLRVVSKKRRNLIGNSETKTMKLEKMDEIEKQAVNMSDIRNDTNASRVTERNSIHATSPSENYNLVNSSQEIPASMKIPFPENFTLPISSQQNSAFVPIASSRPAEMSEHNDVAQQILLQSIPLIDPLLQQIPAIQFCKRLQCIEYLIMNAYIIKCGQYLPQEIYLPFICAVYGADYHLSEWSDEQLKDVMILLSKPAEILLQDDLPSNISIDEVKEVRIPQIERAIKAIRAEKLKRCDKIITRFLKDIFNAISQPDLLEAVREFQKFSDDINTSNIELYGLNILQC
ncbi:Polyribonucleotide nucleotidyltransferase [Dirofilaria immitis]